MKKRKRFFTVFIVPQDPSNIRKFKLSNNLLKVLLVFGSLSFAAFSFVLYDYTNLKLKTHELNTLRKENMAAKAPLLMRLQSPATQSAIRIKTPPTRPLIP